MAEKHINIWLLVEDHRDEAERRYKTPLLTVKPGVDNSVSVSAQAVVDALEHASEKLKTCWPFYSHNERPTLTVIH
jgi:hypothetical protein